MGNLRHSELYDIIQNDIQILYSELATIQIDTISLLITVGALLFSGIFSNLDKNFPGWIPISLIVIIIISINEISTSITRYKSLQYPNNNYIKTVNNNEKRKIYYLIDLKTKFSIIRPTLTSLSIIIGLYFAIISLYFLQQDLSLSQNKTFMLLLVIFFCISEIFLAELIFPKYLINFNLNNLDSPSLIKRGIDYVCEKFLNFGLKIPVYLTPILILYSMYVQIDSTNPLIFIFIISQYFFLFVLTDIFSRLELQKIVSRKLNWLMKLKDETVEQRISFVDASERVQNLIEKYKLTSLIRYEKSTKLFVFLDPSITYDLNIIHITTNNKIREFLN